jgi:hypothetical protein
MEGKSCCLGQLGAFDDAEVLQGSLNTAGCLSPSHWLLLTIIRQMSHLALKLVWFLKIMFSLAQSYFIYIVKGECVYVQNQVLFLMFFVFVDVLLLFCLVLGIEF